MLYVISGSQGCGKTTTLESLKAEYKINVLERKVSRSVQAEWGMTLAEINANVETTKRFQDEVLHRKIVDETTAIQSPLTWFTERSYADYFTYALIVLGKEPTCSDWIDQYFEKCLRLQQQYEKVYYLTAGHFTVESDVNRAASNQHYSRMVDQVMQDVTQRMTSSDVLETITTPNLDLRVATIGTFTTRHKQRLYRPFADGK